MLNIPAGVHGCARQIWGLVKDAAYGWSDHQASRIGAALAFYTVFSLGPILLLAVAAAGFFFGQGAARGEVYHQGGRLGDRGAALGVLLGAGVPVRRGAHPGIRAALRVASGKGYGRGDVLNGAPDWIRTSDLQLRRLPLYPTELRARRPMGTGDDTRTRAAAPFTKARAKQLYFALRVRHSRARRR
jgi:hypothetical protein